MRTLSLLLVAFPLAMFTACTGGKDTGDSSADTDTDTDTDADTDTDTDVDFAMVNFSGDCSSTSCDYTITTTREPAVVELDMTETDDSYLYHEYHDEFVLESINADNSETWALNLVCVSDPADVGANTTLTCPDTVQDGLTWVFGAEDSAGTYDCIVTGDNPDYYSDWGCSVQ